MTENEFLLADRVQKIQQIIGKYGEENFYIAFSGGKDSTVLSELIDYAIPGNTIPRVFANTGIEYRMIVDFVKKKAERDNRVKIITPSVNIKIMLEQEGYPFKSKEHAKWVDAYQRKGRTQPIENYTHSEKRNKDLNHVCPKKLLYQFEDDFNIRISDKCCVRMKEQPLDKWKKENGRKYGITGVMRSEGGRRANAKCLLVVGEKLKLFQPMAVLTSEWEEWFIEEHHVEICDLYKPPYNFQRTGCKGCPFALHLQNELDTIEKFFPAERKQCELIWKPIYDEYRRIRYRLKEQEENHQYSLYEWGLCDNNG